MEPVLTISIPTWHNPQQLGWCIRSLLQYTDYPYKVIVVDNGGDSDIEDWIGEVWNRVEVLRPGHNLGWCKAQNLVLNRCDTPYFCCLNDDVVFLPSQATFWRALIEHFADPKLAAVAPCSNFVAGAQSLMQMDIPNLCETSLLIGMCAVFHTDRLKEVGGFDESLPGGDDLDWSIRLRQAGYKLAINRFCYLHHFGQQTGKRVKGDWWDSDEHSEITNNALIRKHGIKAWYDTFQARAWPMESMTETYAKEQSDESWVGSRLGKYCGNGAVGINIGCGNQQARG